MTNSAPISPWQAQWRRFVQVRRAWWSLVILVGLFVISLFSELISNDKPLLLKYGEEWHMPFLFFYPETKFGGQHGTEPDYAELTQRAAFQENGWALFAPMPYGPVRSRLDLPGNPPHAPSWEHWLGTDNSARDVFSRLLYGFRISMIFAILLVGIGVVLGIIIGAIQGYAGGWVDITAQRLIEIWSAVPFLYMVIMIGSIYGQSFWLLLGLMALFEWINLSYYMRGEFFRLKNQAFVLSSRALGGSHSRVIFQQILPNGLGPVITFTPFNIIGAILSLTALDFLGFGLPPPTPSWGELLQQSTRNLDKPWLVISTLCALFITLMLASFIGEGVREAFDPKAKNRQK